MTVIEALHEKDRARDAAERKAERRRQELYEAIPELVTLDDQISAIGPRIALAMFRGNETELADAKRENREKRAARAQLLMDHGYAPDEDAPVYQCAECKDSGYVGDVAKVGLQGQKLCDCVRKRVAYAAFAESGLGKGLSDKTFSNFSLQYYKGEDYAHMNAVLSVCRGYANGFDRNAGSLLFMGRTGLGKTHLSAAIAGEAAHKGFRVLYESAQKLFDTYEAARFGRDSEGKVEQYENVDLLIIDDLGAECASSYTAATFFNLLNTRLINGMPMLINTNLGKQQLEKAYGERVLSRLLGEFRVLLFKGEDVRMQNLRGSSV